MVPKKKIEGIKGRNLKKKFLWKFPKKEKKINLVVVREYKPSFWHKDIRFKTEKLEQLKAALNPKKPKKTKKKPMPKKKAADTRPKYQRIIIGTLKVIVLSVSFSGLLFTGAVYAYRGQYAQKAMFGTKLLGEDVGGKTKDEIQKILEKKISEITFSFKVDDQNIVIKPEEAGIVFKTGDTANAAVTKGKTGPWYRPYLHSVSSLLYLVYPPVGEKIDRDIQENLSMEFEINENILSQFTQGLSTKFNVDSQNAGLVMNGTDVSVIPAVAGRKIVTESVRMQVTESLKSVKTSEIKIDVEKVNPAIIEQDTLESIAAAKIILNLPVSYHYQGQNFNPDKLTVAKWITFKTIDEKGKQKLVPVVDSKMTYSYIYTLAGKINIPAVNKKVTVKNGAEQVVEQEGKDGLAVDIDQAAVTTAGNLSAGKGVNMELPTYVTKSKTQVNNIIVADWAKYIEINLSTQKMAAYTAGGVLVNSWSITSGASSKGYASPTGTFLILRKSGEGGVPGSAGGGICMPNPPSAYPLCGINYVSTFTGQGHAIHEAWWRSSFGGQDYKWNGSHGCINATFDVAKFIFYWAPIGTPVIIHY